MSRVRASEAPTKPAKSRPTSRRSKGMLQLWAMALAVSDLPVPWGPTSNTPRGMGRSSRVMLSSSSLALPAELLDDLVRHRMLRAWLRG